MFVEDSTRKHVFKLSEICDTLRISCIGKKKKVRIQNTMVNRCGFFLSVPSWVFWELL